MSHKIQPENVFAAAVCMMVALSVLLFVHESHADEVYANSKIEQAVCQTYWSEPVTIVCRTKTQTCTFYPDSGEGQCIQFEE